MRPTARSLDQTAEGGPKMLCGSIALSGKKKE